jgi:ubiquinone/menaquinone biosynthesis C-methylase UbiE
MNHDDHVSLLREGVPGAGTWADLGSGSGAFTLALAELLGPDGEIYSVDRDTGSLREQERAMHSLFPDSTVHYIVADFTAPLDLPPLDGVVMANSLHYQRDKLPVLRRVRSLLKPGGALLVVEYDTDRGNRWVPYPVTFEMWRRLAGEAGFVDTRLLATHPSRFLGRFFSSASLNPPA